MATYTVANLGDVLVMQVVVGTTNFAVLPPTTYVAMRQSAATAVTITLPPTPGLGYSVTIKDSLGVCASHPFTVITTDGSMIDGASSFLMTYNFQSQQFVFDGVGWGVNG